MGCINLKSIVRTCFGFVNFRTMIMLNMWWLKHRRNRTFFLFEGREYTYGEVYRQAQRYERFFLAERDRLVRAGKLGTSDRLALGIYMENAPEFIFASLAAGLSNSVLFAINTGFRGETLAKVMEQAKIAFLITDEASATEVEKALPGVSVFGRNDVLFVGDTGRIAGRGYTPIEEAISRTATTEHPLPRVPIDNFSPVIIIYTSGTTSLPKAVPCAHVKMPGAGFVVQKDVRLTKRDRGYISMPLFHSNAWYIGILPQMIAGCSFVLKRRFSARAFEEDMLQYGVTFLNYVGQPLHYIIDALEKKYGSGEAVEKALARHPKNRFRLAYGNGASVVDRLKLMRYLGMEHIFEIYGSTEAVITTANRRGDPIESVGRAPKSVVILSEQGMESPPESWTKGGGSSTTTRRWARSAAESARTTSGSADTWRLQGHEPELPGRDLSLGRSRTHPYGKGQTLPLLQRPHGRLDPEGRRKLLGRERAPVRPADARRGHRHRLRGALRRVRREGNGHRADEEGGGVRSGQGPPMA
jgi:fatty-acyl-CoA synthase